jgi:anti-anti-sigma factor
MPTHDYAPEPEDTARPIPVVRPRGDLDSESLWPLSQELNAAVAAGSPVVLDAGGITFGDSSFLRVLLDVHHRADLRIAAVPESLGRVLRLVGLDLTLKIYPTVEEAQVTRVPTSGAREGTVNAP